MKIIQDIGALIILWLILCCVVLSLTGCSRKTPVDDAFQDVNTSIVTLKDELPPECKTDLILKNIEKLELNNQFAEQVCKSKIKDLESKNERLWWIIIFAIFAFAVRFFIKK